MSDFHIQTMVGVAQVVEPQVVALVVVGSSPITHPIYKFETGFRHLTSVFRPLMSVICILNSVFRSNMRP